MGDSQNSLQLLIKVAQSLMDRNKELASVASRLPLSFVMEMLQSGGESVRLQAYTAWLFSHHFQIYWMRLWSPVSPLQPAQTDLYWVFLNPQCGTALRVCVNVIVCLSLYMPVGHSKR